MSLSSILIQGLTHGENALVVPEATLRLSGGGEMGASAGLRFPVGALDEGGAMIDGIDENGLLCAPI